MESKTQVEELLVVQTVIVRCLSAHAEQPADGIYVPTKARNASQDAFSNAAYCTDKRVKS